jgi:hypothetical protein
VQNGKWLITGYTARAARMPTLRLNTGVFAKQALVAFARNRDNVLDLSAPLPVSDVQLYLLGSCWSKAALYNN